MMLAEKTYNDQKTMLKYYEAKNDLQPLVLLHAQGVDSLSFADVAKPLSNPHRGSREKRPSIT